LAQVKEQNTNLPFMVAELGESPSSGIRLNLIRSVRSLIHDGCRRRGSSDGCSDASRWR
jgi:hypothetical protein